MKIMMVIETLEPGGAETFAVRLANALSARHAVLLAVLHGERIHRAVSNQVLPGVRVEPLTVPGKRALQKIDGLLRRMGIDQSIVGRSQRSWLRRLIAQFRPDIVHSHLAPADIVVSTVAEGRMDFSHVITVHGDYAAYLSGATRPLFLNAKNKMAQALAQADGIVSITADQEQRLLAAFPELDGKLTVIPNGFAPPPSDSQPGRSELGLPEHGLLVGMVSRGVEKKGWAAAIEAFRRAGLDEACLVLVGSGPFLDGLQNLPPNMICTGFSDRPTDLIRHFDLCLLPSEFPHETLPTAVIEYLYCGKPVIATDVGAIGTMIENPVGERAGILVKLDGTVDIDQLADAIRTLGTDPDKRARLGAIAPGAFAKFSMRDCCERYESLYRSLRN